MFVQAEEMRQRKLKILYPSLDNLLDMLDNEVMHGNTTEPS